MSDDGVFRDNPDAKRYELEVEGGVAVMTYNFNPPNMMITETLVPEALEGRGLAGRLAAHVVADVQARELVLLPVCPYLSAWLKKHPEHADVVHPTYRGILGI
ncbi:GNAT family N-acetyltransferase [Brevundimonas balnearis]|uniref:GNAT family N-acetyltransferase n=1 Tax=Brevundimonas balnearis TaxID=1572858 RepID=A0ABV6R5J7_9CAUL